MATCIHCGHEYEAGDDPLEHLELMAAAHKAREALESRLYRLGHKLQSQADVARWLGTVTELGVDPLKVVPAVPRHLQGFLPPEVLEAQHAATLRRIGRY